jgi:transposase-like protein
MRLLGRLGLPKSRHGSCSIGSREAAKDEEFEEPLFDEVECDETYVGGRTKFKHARKIAQLPQKPSIHDKTPVMGILQRGGQVRAMVVKNHKRVSLQAEIRKHIAPGSTVYTDDLHSYRGLHEYHHHYVDHLTKYVSGKIHTNGLENFWSLLKRSIKGTYIQVSPWHLQSYVAEQVHRFNTRKKLPIHRGKALLSAAGRHHWKAAHIQATDSTLLAAYHFCMSEEQQRFDDLMKKVIKVSPEELKRRLEESKIIKSKVEEKVKQETDDSSHS